MPLDARTARTTSTSLPDEHRLYLARLQDAQAVADSAAVRASRATQGNVHLSGWLLLGWSTADQELQDALRMIGVHQVAARACREPPG